MTLETLSNEPKPQARVRVVVPAELRIALEVAGQLRISPRFSDDGRPEGTLDRPRTAKKGAFKDPFDEETEDAPDVNVYDLNP